MVQSGSLSLTEVEFLCSLLDQIATMPPHRLLSMAVNIAGAHQYGIYWPQERKQWVNITYRSSGGTIDEEMHDPLFLLSLDEQRFMLSCLLDGMDRVKFEEALNARS